MGCETCGAKLYYEDGIYKTCDNCGKLTKQCICKINMSGE